jgi:hypothetical protein
MRDARARVLALTAGAAIAAIALLAVVAVLVPNGADGQPASPAAFGFNCNGFPSVSVSSTLPADLNLAAQQPGADCYAWQSFIALNWRAGKPGQPDPSASPADFGKPPSDPAHPAPVVWQTFVEQHAALTPGGGGAPAPLMLTMIAKAGDRVILNHTGQAFTNGAWLTDQAKGLTYYEILVNADEYNYIQKNQLYTAAGQRACASSPAGFNLPDGTQSQFLCDAKKTPYSYGSTGSIETKSAWIVLNPNDAAQLRKYLIARACVAPPGAIRCPLGAPAKTVGLVGLHIIRKTRSAQQFVWSTFEHVDNDPDRSDAATTKRAYTYFNPNCDKATDPYQCVPNRMPVPVPTAGATMSPRDAAVQVVRELQVSNMVTSLNRSVWGILPSDSVFRNYRLIDVIWPTSNRRIAAGAVIPLTDGAPQVEMQPLTNTTLETYFQLPGPYAIPKDGCMDCHMGASIARSKNLVRIGGRNAIIIPDARKTGSQTGTYAADYSFIFAGVK